MRKFTLIFSLLIGYTTLGLTTALQPMEFQLCYDNTTEWVEMSFNFRSDRLTSVVTIESNDCSGAMALATDGSVTDSGTNTGSDQEPGEPIPTGLTGPISSVWYEITTMGANTTLNIDLTLMTSIVDPVIAIYENTCVPSTAPIAELSATMTGMYDLCLPAGTYLLQLATDQGNEGDYEITLMADMSASPLNEDCAGANNVPVDPGVNSVDNNCSTDGLVWFEYTVTTGDHIDVTAAAPFSVTNIFLNDCTTQVTSTTCLTPGTILHIEAGDATPSFGIFDLTINELDNTVPNDDCIDAESSPLGTLTCSNSLTGSGDNQACPDPEATCTTGIQGVWYNFTVDAQVTQFGITGNDFQVFYGGDCTTLISLGCDGSVNEIDPSSTGTNFYVLVFDDGVTSGSFTATATPQTPANDLCGSGFTLTDGTPETGTTACASAPAFSFCNVTTTADHAVFYEYTTPNNDQTTNLTFNYNGSGANPASDLGVAVYSGCGGTELFTSCNSSGEVFMCAYPNTTYIIAVGSSDGNEGEFTITVNEDNSTLLTNDLCSSPTDITPAQDCDWTIVNDDLTNACVETFNEACNQLNTPTAWYSFSMPANGVGLDIQNLNGSPSIQIFNDDCNDPATGPSSVSGCINSPGFQALGAGNYLMSVSAAGAFDFEFRTKVPPANDVCSSAVPLSLSTVETGTTECATFVGENSASCDGNPQNLVWYTFDVVNAVKTLTINVNNLSSGGILNVVAWDACNSGTYYNNDPNNEACASNVSLDIDCPPVGTTIYISVATDQSSEGTFDIEVIESQSIVPANDACANATLSNGPNCTVYQANGDNEFACPESFDVGGCGFDSEEVVWYEVQLPPDATSIDIGINNYSGAGTGFFSVFTDCNGSSLDGNCYTNISSGDPVNSGVNIDVSGVAGSSIYIGFGSQGDTGGAHSIDIQINNTPTNDDPCSPDVFPGGGGTISGNTECTTQDYVDPACPTTYENSVWYEYTLGGGETGIEVEITNTSAGPFGVSIVDQMGNCNGAPMVFTNASSCSGETETVIAACLPPNQTVHIVVATSESNAGTFDITVTPIIPQASCIDNDECSMAEDLGTLVSDAGCIVHTDCNEGACPDMVGSCNGGAEVNNVVWYTVQNDGSGDFISVEVSNATFDAPVVGVFVGPDCNNLTQIGGCTTGSGGVASTGPIDIDPGNPPIAGENYYIAVGSDGASGGDFDLCIEIINGCVNDDPCDAVQLDEGVTIMNPTSTENCTMDDDNPNCPDLTENTIWYKFTVPAGNSSVSISIAGIGVDYSIQVGEYVSGSPGCANQNPPVYDACGTQQVHKIFCLKEDTEYYIQIGTSAGSPTSGFEININTSPGLSQNDLCSDAAGNSLFQLDIDMADYCQFTAISSTTFDACPDDLIVGDCDYTAIPTAWIQVNIPNDPALTEMDLLLEDITQQEGIFSVFEGDCNNLTPLPGAECGLAGAPVEGITLTPGATYYVAVASINDMPGDFDFNVKVLAPPSNDLCENATQMSIGESLTGTTECATNSMDYDFIGCSADLNESDVWYEIVLTGDETVISVEISGFTGAGNYGAIAYFTDSDCGALTPVEVEGQIVEDCAGPKNLEIPVKCLNPQPSSIFIKVGSPSDDNNPGNGEEQGEFTINVSNINPSCSYADECDEISSVMTPVTDPDGVIIYTACEEGCLEYACPQNDVGDCMFNTNPTVWFQVDTDMEAQQLYVTVTTNGSWQPVFAIYMGDCSNLTLVPGGTVNAPINCNTDDTTPEVSNIGIQTDANGDPISTYYIAVSADGMVDDPSFNICTATTVGTVACLGGIPPDYLNFSCDPAAVFEITGRSNDPNGDLGLPLEGPFCPGETIDLHFEFFYDATATGNDWLQGIVPKFGEAVDVTQFDPNNITVSPAGAQWFMEGVPIVNEDVPQLCTYTDANGVLQICNPNCENCPCQGPMLAGDPLPGGWFWVSNGGGGCANDGTPATMYGIPGGTQVNVEFDIQMTIKEFQDMAECLNFQNDLTFSIQTFSDGVTGCWEDPTAECLKDVNQVISYPIECELPPGVIANPNPVEICSGDELLVNVTTDDGSNLEIIVTPEDNPDVDGENEYTFMGSGDITDVLINNSGSVQTVTYILQAIDPDIFCPGPKDTLIVTIYPEILIEFTDVYVCEGLCTDLTPDMVSGGTGNYIEYVWSTGETTTSINVCPTVPTTYILEVTDDLGCTGSAEVEVDVKPKVDAEFDPDEQVFCIDGVLGNDPPIVVNILDGSEPYTFFWTTSPFGLTGAVDPIGTNYPDDSYIIEAEDSNPSFVGPYEVCVEIQDLFGCADTVCMEATVLTEPIATFALETPLQCGQTLVNLVADYDESTSLSGFNYFELFDCDGNFLQQGGTNPTVFADLDLEDANCFVLVSYSLDGCTDNDTLDLMITQGIPAELMGDANICIGESADIEVVNNSDYVSWEWNNNENNSMITVSPDTTTTYVVTVTESSGCTDVAAFEVVVNNNPQIQIAGSTSFCTGSSTTLIATSQPGATFVWNGPAGPISMTNQALISAAGSYTVVVTLNGCISDSTIMVTEDSNLNINLNEPSLCDNSTDTLFAGNNFDMYVWSYNDLILNDEDTSFLVINQAGQYAVTVTDITGCFGVDTVEIENFTTPSAMVTDTVEACRQVGVGNVHINFNAQVTGSTGTWSDTDLTGVDLSNLDSISFEGIARDTYSFTFTTNTAMGNCQNVSYVMEVIVKSCPCPVVATRSIPDQCNNQGTIIDLNEYLTSPSVQIGFWSFISGPESLTIVNDSVDITGVQEGDYIVRWNLQTSIMGCPDSSEQTITIYDAPYAELDPAPKNLCNTDSGLGEFEVDLNTYLLPGSDAGTWKQTGGPAVDLTNLPIISGLGLNAGDIIQFTYTANSATSPCEDVELVADILIRDCSCPFAVIDVLPFACNSGTTIMLDNFLTTSPAGLTGTWSIDYMPNPISGNILDATGIPSGMYTISYTLTNDPGPQCTRVFTQDLFVRRQPVAEVIGSGTPCNTNATGNDITTVDLFSLLAPNPSNGTWTQTGGTPTLTIDANGVVDFEGLNIGDTFEFTYTTNTALSPCVDISVPVTVTVIDCNCPNIDINPVGPLCNSDLELDLSTLQGPSIDAGTWTVTGPSGNITLNGTILTIEDLPEGDYDLTYTLTPTPPAGCQEDTTQVLTIIDQPEATVLPTAEACSEDIGGMNGNVINLFDQVTAGDTDGKWYWPNGDEIAIPNFADFQLYNIGDIVTVTYVLTADAPCVDQVYEVNVEILDCACPPITTQDFEACSTEGVIDLTPYGDPMQAGIFQSSDVTISGTTVDVTDLDGNYMIDFVLDNPEPNCPDRETFIMTVIQQFNPGTASETSVCVGEDEIVNLFNLLEGEDPGGVWTETSTQPTTGGVFDPGTGTLNTSGVAVGTYRFTYTFSNNSPCPDVSSEVTVTIQNIPPVDAGEAQTLDCALLTATLGGTPGNPNFDYEWIHDGGLTVPNGNQAITTVDFPGVFTLIVTDRITGCQASDQVTIDLSTDRPVADLTSQNVSCFGEGDGSINVINVVGGTPPYQYSNNGGTTFQNSPNFLNLAPGSYEMVISDNGGCVIDLGTIDITEPPLLSVDLGSNQTVKLEETVSFNIEGQFDINNITSLVWTLTTDNGDSIICNGLAECLSYDYFAIQSGRICVRVVDQNGCIAEDCVNINVIRVRDITLPDIFTPNTGDDINNVFFVNDNDVEMVNKFIIFDRWGNKVFSLEDVPPNDPQYGWDGTFNGVDVENGVFVYVIEVLYTGGLNETETFSGDITVLR